MRLSSKILEVPDRYNFIGAFAKLRIMTISFVVSVRLSVSLSTSDKVCRDNQNIYFMSEKPLKSCYL